MFIDDNYYDYNQTFKIYSTLKFIIGVVGSNAVPIMMMKEGGGYYCISVNRYDWEVIAIATTINLWCYQVPFKGSHFDKKKQIYLSIELVIDTLRDLIYAVENNHWPDKTLKLNSNFIRLFAENPH